MESIDRRAIRAARQSLGWTQSKLASKAKIDRSKLSLFEIGQVRLSAEERSRVDDALNDARVPRRFVQALQRTFRRQQAGMSQQELANRAQISRSKLSRWENGLLELTSEELSKVEEELGGASSPGRATVLGPSQVRMGNLRDLGQVRSLPDVAAPQEVQRLKALLQTMEKLISGQEQLIDLLQEFVKFQEKENAEQVASLQKKVNELRNLYELETRISVDTVQAEELRERLSAVPIKEGKV
jgi:transcriptional regulator with XRE-family HTH domain